MSKFDGFKKTSQELDVEGSLEEHCETFGIAPYEAVKMFPVLVRRQMLKRFLAHVDLFKLTLEIPGDIAELGVFRGMGLMTWANLLESYCISDRTKTVYGFDNWAGFSELRPEDGVEIPTAGKTTGGFNPAAFKQELLRAITIFDSDRFIPWKPRIRLIDGQIEQTVPQFMQDNPGIRFSLVHFDCDLYAPTKAALAAIWPRVSRGGLVLFDEYGIPDWPGETQAVDEFLAGHPDLQLKTLTWNNVPAAYLVKP